MNLQDTTAIITGSSGQLGSAIALALAKAGCHCICHYYRNKDRAEKIAEQIAKNNVQAKAVQADLTEERQIQVLFEAADDFKPASILINSAAVFLKQPLPEATSEQSRKVFNLNLSAAILTSRYFAEKMKEKFGHSKEVYGKIINIADTGGIRPWAEYVLYCASKAGLIGATKALAKELAPGICVNALAPGLVYRPNNFDEQQKKRQLSFIPVKRFARPEEITEAVIFLLENDYITGQVLCVDGGRCI